MAQELIHVHIGIFIGNYPVRKHITSGPMAGMIELQQSKDTIAWVHQKWCSEIGDNGDFQKSPSVTIDTDWRKFLRDHWLQDRNMLNPDYAEEFMKVLRSVQTGRKSATALRYILLSRTIRITILKRSSLNLLLLQNGNIHQTLHRDIARRHNNARSLWTSR